MSLNSNLRTGCSLVIKNINNEQIAYGLIAVKGDINGDSIISVADFLMLKENINNSNLSKEQLTAADIDKNGVINSKDLVMIESHLLGRVSLSTIDPRTLSNKNGVITIKENNQVHVGDIAKFDVIIETSDCKGINGLISFDNNILHIDDISSDMESNDCILNYSVNGNKIYFNMYRSSSSNTLNESTILFTITAKVSESADTGAELTFLPIYANTNLISLEVEKMSFKLLQQLSDDATLQSIKILNYEDAFIFDSSVLEYVIDVPFQIDSLILDAIPNSEFASVDIPSPALVPGKSKTITITVTAENGNILEYKIIATREIDPSIVYSNENHIKSILPSVGSLSPEFNSEIFKYTLTLPKGTYSVQFDLETVDEKAACEYYLNASKHYIIKCTAEDGTVREYDIALIVDNNSDTSIGDPLQSNIALYSAILAGLLIIGFILGFVLYWRKK